MNEYFTRLLGGIAGLNRPAGDYMICGKPESGVLCELHTNDERTEVVRQKDIPQCI